ncbi:M24 family metallopeptidase [Psychroserpens sp.]|uniref:M24 family metallopeptidase n=1 Tax=Psychroserpens sp. TaxID=2020870 RepID=UPI001B21EE3E|nr:M24 family metallopeptidase [Psychroserpens sp.]MBO6606615.1 M24 family metallopeptidase [Psychroserpens sp.]MBO6653319.1 M24 family metallopeptidase [Psychroserpens sp.]MBO6680654.1 M24 family metallopeptidase [Psychroserpens sp.]MBO6750388.1 M24 family metallopeptidase [Psychroserpens sp.]MBO6914870.1 M24 family metallopeptidase [Psychroserpens sp.]
MKKLWLLLCLLTLQISAQQVLSVKEQAQVVDEILAERFNTVLPELMDRTNVDMWVIISREYNEDPVLKTMLPATWLNARRRTIILFYRNKTNNTIEKLAVARYNFGDNIISAWDKEKEPDQWKRLIQLIEERNPETIGLNYSTDFNIADGIVKTDYDEFMSYLPKPYHSKVISAEKLAIGWIETRTPREMVIYNQLVDITHDIIAEAFSEKVITAGITTTTDVEWWMRQKIVDLGLKTWFHPTVDVQRTKDELKGHLYSFSDRPEKQIIMPGDLVHCDIGISYLRLNTDCQELAYVLRPNETEPPKYLLDALKEGNRVQDIFTNNFKTGETGNAILLKSLNEAKAEGLRPSIYTHPLGSYGHSSGPTIGMWDAQGGVEGTGDYPLFPNTVYAIELNTTVNIPEWKRDVRIMLEEAGFYGDDGFRYVNGRQTKLLTIPRVKSHQGN